MGEVIVFLKKNSIKIATKWEGDQLLLDKNLIKFVKKKKL